MQIISVKVLLDNLETYAKFTEPQWSENKAELRLGFRN